MTVVYRDDHDLSAPHDITHYKSVGGRTATVWADERSIHVFIDGELARTRTSQFTAADLKALVQCGGRIAGPEPATPALPDGPQAPLVVEVDRLVGRDGDVGLGGQRVKLAAQLAGQQVTLRFDGQLMHVIVDGLGVLSGDVGDGRRAVRGA